MAEVSNLFSRGGNFAEGVSITALARDYKNGPKEGQLKGLSRNSGAGFRHTFPEQPLRTDSRFDRWLGNCCCWPRVVREKSAPVPEWIRVVLDLVMKRRAPGSDVGINPSPGIVHREPVNEVTNRFTAEELKSFKDRDPEEVAALGRERGYQVQIMPPNTYGTMDYVPGRMRVWVGEDGKVFRATVG